MHAEYAVYRRKRMEMAVFDVLAKRRHGLNDIHVSSSIQRAEFSDLMREGSSKCPNIIRERDD